jgi:hypothetical protein
MGYFYQNRPMKMLKHYIGKYLDLDISEFQSVLHRDLEQLGLTGRLIPDAGPP